MTETKQIKLNKAEKPRFVGKYTFTIRDKATGAIKRQHFYKNIVPTAARALVAENFADPTPRSMLITEFAVGSNVTPPSNASVALGTETFRNNIASLTSSSNFVYATGFIDAPEHSGTYREAGIFTADDVLISHVAINVTKSLTETLTIDFELEII